MTDIGTHRARILVGDAKDKLKTLEDGSVHTVVTSPPYWGLRDYGVDDQLGLEPTPDEYVENLVEVFQEVRRVLRDDGTLWLNLGDSYAGSYGAQGKPERDDYHSDENHPPKNPHRTVDGVKPKDLMGMPWRVAFALQQDGWWLRSDIIWAKAMSGDERMGSCMPESVTDRPTSAHEHLFLFAPSKQYFYDHESVKEEIADSSRRRIAQDSFDQQSGGPSDYGKTGVNPNRSVRKALENFAENPSGANIRDVWHTSPKPFEEAHFAVYPPSLIRPCILAGTSEEGACVKCGAPYERVTKRDGEVEDQGRSAESKYQGNSEKIKGRSHDAHRQLGGNYQKQLEENPLQTVAWVSTCDCPTDQTTPCTVLDPFLGAGTTMLVALQEGRNAVGVELNPEYARLAWDRVRDLAEMPRLDQMGVSR